MSDFSDFIQGSHEYCVTSNLKEAIRLYREGHKNGCACSTLALARMYLSGHAVQEDKEHGQKLVNIATARGVKDVLVQRKDECVHSLYFLAYLYEEGFCGVKRNYSKAMTLHLRGAEQGYTSAMNDIGCLWDNGHGVERSSEKALLWFQRAVDLGDGFSCQNLSNFFYGNDIERSMTYLLQASRLLPYPERLYTSFGYYYHEIMRRIKDPNRTFLGSNVDLYMNAQWYFVGATEQDIDFGEVMEAYLMRGKYCLRGIAGARNFISATYFFCKAARLGHEWALDYLQMEELRPYVQGCMHRCKREEMAWKQANTARKKSELSVCHREIVCMRE